MTKTQYLCRIRDAARAVVSASNVLDRMDAIEKLSEALDANDAYCRKVAGR